MLSSGLAPPLETNLGTAQDLSDNRIKTNESYLPSGLLGPDFAEDKPVFGPVNHRSAPDADTALRQLAIARGTR